MSNVLNTKQILVPIVTQPTPPPLYIQVAKPESYEFRVAETVNKEGKIVKVGLQVRVWEHDELGTGIVKFEWKDVPRVVIFEDGTIISK